MLHMKLSRLKVLLIIGSLLGTFCSFGQSAVVYSFFFRIDPELTQYEKVDYHRKWFSEFSEGDAMPDQLIDSIKLKTELAFSRKLNMPVTMCFHQYKSETHFTSAGMDGVLEGLPESTTFKRGKADCPQNTRFIKLDVQIYSSGGSSITTVNTRTKLKPKVQIAAKVFDENNNEVWKRSVSSSDFAKLRSETRYYDGYDVTLSEVLSPVDIYAMYLMCLDALMSE